jgi:sortase (surface protein transpeptidase)
MMSETFAHTLPGRDEWLHSRLRLVRPVARRPVRPVRPLSIDITPRTYARKPVQLSRSIYEVTKRSATPTVVDRQPALSSGLPVSSSSTARSKFGRLWFKPQLDLSTLLVTMAIVVFGVGLYVGLTGLIATRNVQAQATALTKVANTVAKSSSVSSSANPALSTVKPTASSLASYVVAPNLPRYLIIPKLGVDARVLSVGVNAQGALETPSNIYDTAWYNESAEPGQPGTMLIDGHVSSWTADGVFYGLKTLVAGDLIKVERGDGMVFTYSVVKSQIYPSGNVDMTSAMTPVVAGQPGLNLITCTGDVIPGTSQFSQRIVVYATLQS